MSDSSLDDVLRRLASLEIDSKKAAAQNVAGILPGALTPRLNFGDLLKQFEETPQKTPESDPSSTGSKESKATSAFSMKLPQIERPKFDGKKIGLKRICFLKRNNFSNHSLTLLQKPSLQISPNLKTIPRLKDKARPRARAREKAIAKRREMCQIVGQDFPILRIKMQKLVEILPDFLCPLNVNFVTERVTMRINVG